MKAMFDGGPYAGKVLDLPMPDDASYLTLDETVGRYDRNGTTEAGIASFRWVPAPEPEAVDA